MSAPEIVAAPSFASPVEHLYAELALLDLRLQRQVMRLRGAHQLTEDQFRGLYISDEQVDALLNEGGREQTSNAELTRRIDILEEQIQTSAAETPSLPLAFIERRYGRFAAQLLVIAAASDVDLRYQTLFAYAQNDVTRKSATVDLALQLLCIDDAERIARRDELRPDAPLFRDHLVRLTDDPHDAAPPLLSRYVRTDTRVVDHILGRGALDPALLRIARRIESPPTLRDLQLPDVIREQSEHLLAQLDRSATVLVEGAEGSGRTSYAAALADALGLSLLVVDGSRITAEVIPLIRREALLTGDVIAIANFDALLGDDAARRATRDALAEELLALSTPLFLLSSKAWQPEPAWRDVPSFRIALPIPSFAVRSVLWRKALEAAGVRAGDAEMSDAAAKFLLTPGQIQAAAQASASGAALRGDSQSHLSAHDLASGAHAQATHRLRTLAERVESRCEWDDIVLPPRVARQLRDVCRSLRYRHIVYGEWGFDRRLTSGKGLVVLFSGPTGTGKTMAASIVARELGLEMYRIDLSAVVSKYIGETEKNLSTIFDEARSSNAILFFDEADALFGKRSEVKDAHDRYANVETAYLLQRVESYEGCVILATNFSRNLDEAFARRIHHTLEFPLPDVAQRERIWRGMLPAAAPIAPDIDFAFLARQFTLSGGNIRNIVVAAAFAAAAASRPIAMPDFINAIARELQKLGRLPSRMEFGEWYGCVGEGGTV
ncbi:MAG: hypothetical protein QOC81_1081 [Thermoanaerobaculia bacterium]|nr:hypothetical protein [Thermoanaerobaculia bacterium]